MRINLKELRVKIMRNIVWFSCGASSFVTAKLILSNSNAELVYCDTGSEHIDNERFIKDSEDYFNQKITRIKSEKYTDVFDVIQKTRYINGVNGARCTLELKKNPRNKFQLPDDIQYFGYTIEEVHRAERLRNHFFEIDARFPLIEYGLTKVQCVGILQSTGIELPEMYKLGYNNNNCIGCVKGGKGYWNKIRRDFPEQFEKMSIIERDLKAKVFKDVYLDELPINAGRHKDIDIQCDFFCEQYT